MKLFQKLVCMALTATATASLSICAFAADYTFDTAADTDYYPSTSYEDTYGTAYHYGSKNLVDYQIPELPYGVLSTTQTGVMEKLRLPGLQQTVGGSASGIYGVGSGVGIPAVTPVIPSYQEPAYTSAKDMERHPENSIPGHQHEGLGRRNKRKHEKGTGALQLHLSVGRQYRRVRP